MRRETRRKQAARSPGAEAGFTLIEMGIALVVLAILVMGVAVPVRNWMDGLTARSSLNRVAAEIYRTRSLAVLNGLGASLIAVHGSNGCVTAIRVEIPGSDESAYAPLKTAGVCVRHSGDSVLHFNSRGMIKPPTRSFHARHGQRADSLLVSIAGRVRRTY